MCTNVLKGPFVKVLLPWERLLWSRRAIVPAGARYALTDFRLVQVRGHRSAEIAIHDIGEVHRAESFLDHLIGTSTIVVHARDDSRPPLVLRHVRRGPHLAALLELLAGEPRASLDADAVRAALAWEPRGVGSGYREVLVVLAAVFVAVFAVAIGLHPRAASIAYPPDDAIYPNGDKRDREAIVRFMETEVMSWARATLGPLTGGGERVTCETCHGGDGAVREWQMPAVAALPEPHVKLRGWELFSDGMDAQMRNAIYGYSAEEGKQTKAAYMREVVVPGMARLLHRPAYDFTRTYDYNRTRLAFGCYHCHRVK